MDGWPEVTTVAWLTCILMGLPLLAVYLYLRACRERDDAALHAIQSRTIETESTDSAEREAA